MSNATLARLVLSRARFVGAQLSPTSYVFYRQHPAESRAEVLDRLHKERAAAWLEWHRVAGAQ